VIVVARLDSSLSQIDPWLDLAFPLATALLCLDQSRWAYGVLGLWLLLRLTRHALKEHWAWLLVGLFLVNAGIILNDKGMQPSDPTDLMVIALAFAAGLHRSTQQWRTSFAWISSSLIPLGVYSLFLNGPELLKFPGFNVNRLSFLLGVLMITAWGLGRSSSEQRSTIGWLGMASLALPLAVMSGSRAALAAPLLSLLLAAILQHCSKAGSLTKALLGLALVAGLSLGSLQLWYRYSPDAAINRLSDGMRFPTALCWAKAPIQQGKALFGLGYNQKVRSHCDGDHLPIMRAAGRPEGLPHAHNVGAQLMAETGLAGLTALVGTCLWAGQRLRQRLIAAPCGDPIVLNTLLPLGLYLLLMAMSTSYEIYLMLNQVLIGFTLAALTSPNKETAEP